MTSLPLPARLLICAVVCGGASAAAVWLTAVDTWQSTDALACAGILAATAVAERFPLELRYRHERAVYSVADAIWTASLLLVRPSVLALAVGAGVLAGQTLHRRAPLKVAYNVGQFMLGITAALAVFAALGSPPADEPAGWLAAAAAMGAFQALNTVLVGLILSLAEGRPLRQVLLPGTGAVHWVGNIAVGILGALVWTVEPLGVPLLLVPLGFTYAAYRGWLRTLQERDWMADIARTADAIARSRDISTRIAEPGSADAVGHLATTLNHMLARLEESFERERTSIRESAHELRTPITICRGHLEVMEPDPAPDELLETVAIVLDELDRMTRIVEDMTELAHIEDPASLRYSDVELEHFLGEVASKAAPIANGQLSVQPVLEPGLLHGDPQRLTQALINLIKNARDHTPPATSIVLNVASEPLAWRLEVADTGGGLATADEARAFQPFHKGAGSTGSGLGLAIVAGIARAHGGTAGVENRAPWGATFWLRVPR